jgi:hypothetical protein
VYREGKTDRAVCFLVWVRFRPEKTFFRRVIQSYNLGRIAARAENCGPGGGQEQSPATRWFMSTLFELVTAWTVLTVALIILLIYRGTLTMQEDDQLFLGDSEAHMAKEQNEIIQKVNKLGPFVKVLGTLSAVLVLAIAGLAVYQQMTAAQ